MSVVVLCNALIPLDQKLIIPIILGACMGAILPDIQMKKPLKFTIRTFVWYLAQYGNRFCMPIIIKFYAIFFGISVNSCDKRVTHSIPGLFAIFGIFVGTLIIPVTIIQFYFSPSLIYGFFGGAYFGLLLHLIEDLCTRKGIYPLFPFSALKISGSIRPCDRTDNRIAKYQMQHFTMAVLFSGFQWSISWPPLFSIMAGLAALGSCIGAMFYNSDITVTYTEDLRFITGVKPSGAHDDTIYSINHQTHLI